MNKTTKTADANATATAAGSSAAGLTGRRLAAGAVLAALGVAGLTACSAGAGATAALAPQSKPSTAAGASASTNTLVVTTTSTQPPASSTPTTAATPAQTASQQSASAVAAQPISAPATSGTPACGNKDLKLTIGATSAGMGHDDLSLIYTDIAGHACTLQGYPGAAVVDGSHLVLNAVRELNGYIGDMQQLGSAPRVTLEPGRTASAVLEWTVDNGQTCYAKGQGSIEVTAPNTTFTVTVPFIYPYTVGHGAMICSGFEIHPVVAGTIG